MAVSFLPKHAGYTAAVVAVGLLTGAWMLMRVSDTRPASATQTTAKTDVNVEQQYVDITEKQAEVFKVLPTEPLNAQAQRGLFFPQVAANYTGSGEQFSNMATLQPGDNPQTRFALHTAQLNISFVPDIWGQNFRAVESLDAITEQALF